MMSNVCRLVALTMLIGSCSILRMQGVDPEWDRKQEPVCSERYWPVIFDGIVAGSIASFVTQDADSFAPLMSTEQMLSAGAVSLFYAASAFIGASRYQECRKAKAEWIAQDAIQKANAQAGPTSAVPNAPLAPRGSRPLPESTESPSSYVPRPGAEPP